MAEFIVNPRRAPRAPARCRAAVLTPAGAFDTETEDVGARGCQVVAPKLVKKGDPVRIALSAPRVPEELRAGGKVAWVSAQPPWRVGIAFDDAAVEAAERWFELLVAASPGLAAFRRVPERIPLDATVYLGPPPRFLVDFTAEEAGLLRAIASGARIDELKARLRDRWPAAQCALFSLIARQAVTLTRGHAAHPDAWKKVLSEVEASLAVESLGAPEAPFAAPPEPRGAGTTPLPVRSAATPPPPSGPAQTPLSASARPAASPWGTQARDPHPLLELEDEAPLDVAASTPPRGAARAEPVSWSTPPPGAVATGERSAEAQALYDRAVAEIRAGRVQGAMAALREALALAPGDPEIAAALGKLAFRDRIPGSR